MLTPPDAHPNRSPNEQAVVSWSPRVTVLMLLGVAIVSLVGGGGGAFLSLAGLLQAWHLSASATDPHYVPLYLGAALVALLSGLFFWWPLILRPRRLTLGRGAWAGVLSSVVTHPLTWLFYLGVLVLTGTTGDWGVLPAPSVGTVLLSAVGFTLYSLIFLGWFTALLGGLAGAAVALMWMVLTGIDTSARSARQGPSTARGSETLAG